MTDTARQSDSGRTRLLALMDGYEDPALVMARAGEFLESIHRYYAWPGVRLEDPQWDEDPFRDPSWNWRLHVMKSVFYLARACEQSGTDAYLQCAEKLVLSWIDGNCGRESDWPSEHSWGEHSTALRLINWLYFYEVWKSSALFRQDKENLISLALAEHGARLADPEYYVEGHNHGVDRDIAMLALSFMHPGRVDSARLIPLCLSRLRRQLADLVSANGVQLEHSPSYHVVGMVQVTRLRSFLSAWRPDEPLVAELGRLLESMAAFLPHIVRPDGRLVMLGDSTFERLSDYRSLLAPGLAGMPEAQDIVETGSLESRADVAEVYREEGYAVIRDFGQRSLSFRQSFHLFFTAAAHPGRAHGHADALSFVLHAGGRDVLIDHGYYSYRQDAKRAYITGVSAHSTVRVDGRDYPGRDSRIDTFAARAGHTLLRASHRNYEDLQHTRWLLHVKSGLVVVVDDLAPVDGGAAHRQAGTEHRFEQFFHLGRSLHAEVRAHSGNGSEVCVRSRDSGAVLTVTQLSHANASQSTRIAIGEENPMLGWTSAGHAELVPSPVIVTQQEGRAARFVSILDLSCSRQGWSLDAYPPVLRLHWREGDSGAFLELDTERDEARVYPA